VRFETSYARGLLAEMKKTAVLISQFREGFVLSSCESPFHVAESIVDPDDNRAGIINRGDVPRALQTHPTGDFDVLDAGTRDVIVIFRRSSCTKPRTTCCATISVV
jgi:hypothetical protein